MDGVLEILKRNGFEFKKRYGQNFLTDTNFLASVASVADIHDTDTVLEIGAGAGTLTRELAKRAHKVVAVEIDASLEPILSETLKDCQNVRTVFCDVLKCDLSSLVETGYKVVANLPYYVTTPVLFYLLESPLRPQSLTVMVQKEVGERICAAADTEEYGALSVGVQARGTAKIVKTVNRQMFTPPPNVDSVIVKIDLFDTYAFSDSAKFKRVVACAFGNRRKTLVNNLMSSFALTRLQAEDAVKALGRDSKVRGEALNTQEFLSLYQWLNP